MGIMMWIWKNLWRRSW